MTLFRDDGVVPRRSGVKPDGHSLGQRKDWGHWCRKTELGLELCLLLAVWYRKCFLTMFSFHFLVCEMGIRHPYLKGCYACESPGIELAWDQHSASSHSLLSFYQQNWSCRHPWADEKGHFREERTSRSQLPSPLTPRSYYIRHLRPAIAGSRL